MNTGINKMNYNAPLIVRIGLDNEIALQLESVPPIVPGEAIMNVPAYLDNNPFKMNQT